MLGFKLHTFIRELLEAGGLFLIIFLVLHFSIQNFRIDGSSMHPTLLDEQHVIVSKVAYLRLNLSALFQFAPIVDEAEEEVTLIESEELAYGDTVAIVHPLDPTRDLVKRVIGLPGDVIEIEQGQVIRNGRILVEAYVVNGDRRTLESIEVPPDSYYVLGDNRRHSTDSREWGFVPSDHIIGRAWLSYWPSDRLEFIHPLW